MVTSGVARPVADPPATARRGLHDVRSWQAARELAGGSVGPVGTQWLPLGRAAGAVLATDTVALSDLPQTDVSAMDGWAVAGPPPWLVSGSVLAGTVPPGLASGHATAIATGAMVPVGADGVLRRERGRTTGPVLAPAGPPLPAEAVSRLLGDLRRAGSECRAGDVVLPAGSRLGPAAVGLLAAAGHDEVQVRWPTVDVLILGDELIASGPAREGRLRDALGPMLAAWLPFFGLRVMSVRHVPDRADALEFAVGDSGADVVVTTGSTARGPVDHLHHVLAQLGSTLPVDGVAVRPGHPQLLALLPGGRPLVGLPGNPLAAVSGLFTLLEPVAAALAAAPPRPALFGSLLEDLSAGDDVTRLVPVTAGRAALFSGPAMLRGLATAEHLAVVPPGGVLAGAPVQLLALP